MLTPQCACSSRYGYGSVEYIDKVVTNYTAANIPLETFVTDSQYMDSDQDFTLSPTYSLPDFQVSAGLYALLYAGFPVRLPRASQV